jgi:hypothetical protein
MPYPHSQAKELFPVVLAWHVWCEPLVESPRVVTWD